MSTPPVRPKIYHITHVNNLPAIIESGGLWSDAEMAARSAAHVNVGMTEIKRRRMQRPVGCWPGTMVGEYVPFYLCPRSIMLYLLHRANHPGVTYTGGQRSIVHLQADLFDVVARAELENQRWAFTTINAATWYADFYNDLRHLDRIEWDAVQASDFSQRATKEGKQAEFLMFGSLPWHWIEEVGVFDSQIEEQVTDVLASARHRPAVQIHRQWYY